MTLTVRSATPADAATVSALAARTFPLACPPELSKEAIDSFVAENLSTDAFHRYLNAPGHAVLVAVDGDGAVRAYALLVDGTVMDHECADMIEGRPTIGVSKFYVDPELHGAGTSGALLDAIESHARTKQIRSLWLATNVGNARARAFYVRNGFMERGNRVFTVGGRDNNDVVLEKTL